MILNLTFLMQVGPQCYFVTSVTIAVRIRTFSVDYSLGQKFGDTSHFALILGENCHNLFHPILSHNFCIS